MPWSVAIDVSARGAVLLGPRVVCDGFYDSVPIRVQTHRHTDHMAGFETSKQFQDIVTSEATRQLLISEFDADLPYRSNLTAVPVDSPVQMGGVQLELVSSGHMLGAVQVAVNYSSGLSIGYSGDFSWPLNRVIEVDELVVDSTYGSPDSARGFSREDVNDCFVDLVRDALAGGPVHIKANRGTLQRAAELISHSIDCPMVATTRLRAELEVYRQFGYAIEEVCDLTESEVLTSTEAGKFIRLYGAGEGDLFGLANGTSIHLSAYWSKEDHPVLQLGTNAYRVAMSDHANFEGTVEYVAATKARAVVTDNSRGGSGVTLARALRRRLGVDARPSSGRLSRAWGR